MNAARIDALIASAWNLHIGPHVFGAEAMTPRKAATMAPVDRATCCHILAERGGCDIYSQADARAALAIVQGVAA